MIRSVICLAVLIGCGSQAELQQPNPPPQWYLDEDAPKVAPSSQPVAKPANGADATEKDAADNDKNDTDSQDDTPQTPPNAGDAQ